jgi:hypothetical protein
MVDVPNEQLTRESLLKVVEDDSGWKVVCRWCNESLAVPVPFYGQDAFNPVTKKRFRIKTKEQLMVNFLELHFGKHMRQLNPQWSDKKKITRGAAITKPRNTNEVRG